MPPGVTVCLPLIRLGPGDGGVGRYYAATLKWVSEVYESWSALVTLWLGPVTPID